MVKLDKIYTKGGDQGLTSLGNGDRVKKHHIRVRAYGEIDEVNSLIGVSIIYCKTKVKGILKIVQNDLFDIGADLCMPENSNKKKLKLCNEQVKYLENMIDSINSELDDLKSFILPGGSIPSAFLHLARCVARRAERELSKLNEVEKVNDFVFQYVNRLSDLLFVASRYENKMSGDVLWEPGKFQKGK